MANFEHSIRIQRPVSDVFGYVADWRNTPEWQTGTGGVTVVPDKPLRVGSMVTQERRSGGADLLLNADVTDYKPNRQLELRGVLGRFQFRDTFSFESEGRSTVVKHERATGGGILARLFAPLMPFRMNRVMSSDLERLKKVLESH